MFIQEELSGDGRATRSRVRVSGPRRETGQSLVEFGRGFQSWLTITNAAAFGARTGAIGAPADVVDAATRDAAASLDPTALNVQITNAQGSPGDPVSVRVTYDLPMITPIFAVLVPGGAISITADATQRLE